MQNSVLGMNGKALLSLVVGCGAGQNYNVAILRFQLDGCHETSDLINGYPF